MFNLLRNLASRQKNEKGDSNTKGATMYLFLALLLLIVFIESGYFDVLNFLVPFKTYVYSLIIITGAITFLQNKESFTGFEDSKESLEKYEKWYVLALVLIICIYITIRAPYLNKPFGGVWHSDKYGTYLPNLIYMYESGNPFLNINTYYSTQNMAFNHFPFFEWGILPFMFLTEFISFEMLVRSLLTISGILLLILIYLFFSEIFNKKIALIGTLLLAVNPLFNVLTYVTFMDLPAILFMFISLNLYLRGKKEASYVFCGLSILAKYSFLLISFPILFLLIILEKEDKLYNLLNLGLFSFLPIFLHDLLIKPIPFQPYSLAFLRLILMPVFIILPYYIVKKENTLFKSIINRLDDKIKILLVLLSIPVAILLLWDKISSYSSSFLTDQYLIFNWPVYSTLLEKIKFLTPDFAYYLFPLGFMFAFFDNKNRRIVLSLIFAAIIYAVIAMKAVWIHLYYKHIFVIVSILIVCYVFTVVERIKWNKVLKLSFFILLITLLTLPPSDDSKNVLKREYIGIKETASYLRMKMDEDDKIFKTTRHIALLQIYGLKNRLIGLKELEDGELRDKIKKEGFTKVMKQRFKYFVSYGRGDFKVFLRFFDQKTESKSKFPSKRTEIILESIGQIRKSTNSNDDVLRKYNPSQYFILERKIGNFYIYRLR